MTMMTDSALIPSRDGITPMSGDRSPEPSDLGTLRASSHASSANFIKTDSAHAPMTAEKAYTTHRSAQQLSQALFEPHGPMSAPGEIAMFSRYDLSRCRATAKSLARCANAGHEIPDGLWLRIGACK